MKKILYIIAVLTILAATLGFTVSSQEVETWTVYYRNNDAFVITESYKEVQEYLDTKMWYFEPAISIYDIYNNEYKVFPYELQDHLDLGFSMEKFSTLYTADGRIIQARNSEVESLTKVGWSLNPPITIYSITQERSILIEEKEDYLATGVWFATYEEAHPCKFSYNPFVKSNCSIAQLNQMLKGTGLAGYGEAFYRMEKNYGVNAVFAIGVACHESGNGTSYSFKNRNNPFGIGPKKCFSSIGSAIDYFGQLMNKKLYRGKSIEGIGNYYCQDGTNWSGMVKDHMIKKWNKIS